MFGGIIWIAFSILYYLFLGLPTEKVGEVFVRPFWYRIGIYIVETVPILAASFLCLRNWFSPKIIGGRNVWLGIGIGVLSWGIGNLVFAYIELVLKGTPFPSVADIFFVTFYVCLSISLALSVMRKRFKLSLWQWGIVALVGSLGLAIAGFVTFIAGNDGKPIEFNLDKILGTVYAVGDVWLLIVATMLLLAFWGGKFGQSWRLLAAAAISMFLGDLGFNYLQNIATADRPYQSGEFVELFWVLAFILFGMAAAVELQLSSGRTSRRGGSKRTAN